MEFDNTQEPEQPQQPEQTQQPQESQPTQQPEIPPAQPVSTPIPPQQQPSGHNIPDFAMPVYDPTQQTKKKGSGWKIFWGIVITLSLLANGVMFIGIIGMAAMSSMIPSASSSATIQDNLREKVLVSGAKNKKIAVINVVGVINNETSTWVRKQMKRCDKDASVRGLIVRINSPGGMVSSSDQIHYEISKFRENSNKPVLCFMQGIAASGGYYSAVACDEIMAEPTVITGSIGVIMNFMVVKELLEEKLGIDPVTIKSGRRKDWPSMYNETTDEQKVYLNDKIIAPAYDRFVELIVKGRKDVLDEEQIRTLADGSIYSAPEAKENKLIDEIGYLDDAMARVQEMANITGAQIVEYEEVFSVWNMLGAEAKARKQFDIETELLEKIAAPKILYLWDGRE